MELIKSGYEEIDPRRSVARRLETEMDEPATRQALARLCRDEPTRSEGRLVDMESLRLSHCPKDVSRLHNLQRA